MGGECLIFDLAKLSIHFKLQDHLKR